jgi:hypothetical protein
MNSKLSLLPLQEMVQQNQAILTAVQGGSASTETLRQHIVSLTKQMENIKEQHR